MTNNAFITLDVRNLESPKPLQTILKAITDNYKDNYKDNKTIVVIHRIEPFGLYPYLQKLGFEYTCKQVNSHYEITIKRNELKYS